MKSGSSDKIVQVGVGEHTPHTLASAYVDPQAHVEALGFVDVSEERLEAVAATCRALNEVTGKRIVVETSTETAEVLPGATMVILAYAVGYPQLVLETYARADKYGIPIGEAETLGIGGGLMGLRHLKVGMPIMDLVKQVCPEAWCVVSTNPIRHMTDYANRYAGIRKSMGLCHGTKATLRYIEKCLEMEYGALESIVVGANHLIWYLKIWERATGEDWYPKLAEILQERDLDGHMGRYLYSIFGLYPGNGPGHVPDGFGFFTKRLWEKYTVHRCVTTKNYDPFLEYTKKGTTAGSIHVEADKAAEGNKRWVGYLRAVRDGGMEAAELLGILQENLDEDPVDQILTTLHRPDTMYYTEALNLPNGSAVPNLPADAILEIPGVANRTGAYPLALGAIPEAIAELVSRQVVIQKLQVDAAATGSKQALLQSVLLDPLVHDLDAGVAFVEEEIAAHPEVYPEMR